MIRRFLFVVLLFGVGLAPGQAFSRDLDFSPCDWKKVDETWWKIEDRANLDGRLGSTREAFEAIYGKPAKEGAFTEYKVDGCGPLLVSYDPDGYVTGISVTSPRPENLGGDKTDKEDWFLMPAFTITNSFVPLDWKCKDPEFQSPPMGYVIEECSSEALLDQVPSSAWDYVDNTPSYGSYSVVLYNTNQAGKFWMITISLGFDPEDFPESYP